MVSSSSKDKSRTTLPSSFKFDRRSLSHSHSQSQLQSNVHAQLGPWAQWGHTSASLGGSEAIKRPVLTHSLTLGNEHHFSKDSLPVIPGVVVKKLGRGSRRLDGWLHEYGDPVPRPSMDLSGSKSYDGNVTRKDDTMQKVLRTHSSPETRTLPPHPDLSLSKSAAKVMQRTGYDPTMEIREGKGSRQSSLRIVTDNSDDSSGSNYSQDDGMNLPLAQRKQSIGSVPVSLMQDDEIHLQSPKYNSSNVSSQGCSTPKSLVVSPDYKERVSRFMQGHLGEPNSSRGPYHSESLEDLIDQERVRYEHQGIGGYPLDNSVHNDDMALMPPPLAVPIKKSRESYFSESPEDWEPRTPTTPFLTSEQEQGMHDEPSTVSSTPSMVPPSLVMPERKKNRRRDFSSGNHPLKSPFPFLSPHKTSDSPKSAGSLGEKFSDALKRLSFTRTSPMDRNEVIPNASRSSTGPGTPMPKKSGFMGIKGAPDVIQKSNEHFHEVLEKAKLSVNKKERRRKELKKQIVVVGIMDQTPDGRASEWL
ncbi:hypothetical protein MFRU_009g01590 [Monilinia fructicola]|nr:hypothetical protein MFRU_009g01590 [Monilinia fructicola]